MEKQTVQYALCKSKRNEKERKTERVDKNRLNF